MTGLRFLLPLAFLPLMGSLALAFPGLGQRGFSARLAIRVAAGAVALTGVMLAASIFHLPWKLAWLAPLAVLPAALGGFRRRRSELRRPGTFSGQARFGLAAAALAVCAVAYAAATARATSSDLYLHWGIKGERFAIARGIDAAFLRSPEHFPLHRDYPPLLPFLYAAGELSAGRFAWGAALLLLPIFLGLTVTAFWGSARDRLGDRPAAEMAALLAWLLGLALTVSLSAGNAEAILLFFETLALSGLLLGEATPADEWLVSVALTGVVLTKFEGIFFAGLAIAGASLMLRRGSERLISLARLGALPAAAAAVWISFCARSGILDSYAGGIRSGPVVLANLPIVVRELFRAARYESLGLPWIVVAGLLAASKLGRKSLLPISIAVASIFGNVFIFLHGSDDPSLWITWSAPRLLLTPLLCLFFAAAAAAGPASSTNAPFVSRRK